MADVSGDNKEQSNAIALEENFLKLKETIKFLERDDISLEEAFEQYQNGVKLLKSCNDKLDEVEKKVLILNEAGGLDEF